MYKKVKMESNAMKNQSGGVRYIPQSPGELDGLMFPQLQRVHQQLKSDLEKIEQVSDGSLIYSFSAFWGSRNKVLQKIMLHPPRLF